MSQHPIKDALIGAAIGLVLGILFALNLKTNKRCRELVQLLSNRILLSKAKTNSLK